MALYMKAEYEDGRGVVVRIGPKTMVACERHFNLSTFEQNRYEHTFWKAWHALREAGQEDREFDEWLDVMDIVRAHVDTPENPIADEAVNPDVDPTQKAPPSDT